MDRNSRETLFWIKLIKGLIVAHVQKYLSILDKDMGPVHVLLEVIPKEVFCRFEVPELSGSRELFELHIQVPSHLEFEVDCDVFGITCVVNCLETVLVLETSRGRFPVLEFVPATLRDQLVNCMAAKRKLKYDGVALKTVNSCFF